MLRRVSNPPNPWSTHVEWLDEIPAATLEVFEDQTRTILARNTSPGVGFEYGLNPYRGCQHACAYCEARPRHQWLGLGAGTDFDRKIIVKPRAPDLLRAAFDAPSWRGDVVVMSGATDPYQPLEASYRLTRDCLMVCAEYRNPVAIITKGALIERDLDVLGSIAAEARATVTLSIPFWDAETARALEPLVPSPARRMRTVERLAALGIDVGVAVTPLIAGLADADLPALLAAAKEAGARRITLGFLRLPPPVDAIFEERLQAHFPLGARRVLARLNDAGYQRAVESLYQMTCRRLGLTFHPPGNDFSNTPHAGPPETRSFRRPPAAGQQLRLFSGG